VAFVIIGGLLGRASAKEGSYPHLRIFEDVVQLILGNYVEQVDVDKVMNGAMRGLADSLDPDSAYLSPEEVQQAQSGAPLPAGDVGIDLTRQYYLRVVATRDNSPAAKAGLRTGDYIRMIGTEPTRDMSVWEGARALRGAPGTTVKLTVIRGNAVDPHVVELTRAVLSGPEVTGRIAAPGVGYVRIVAFGPRTTALVRSQIADLSKSGASQFIVDVRRTCGGPIESGLELARLFLPKGSAIALREAKGADRETIAAGDGDGAITQQTTVLIDTGTSGPGELFASALAGNHRADLVGERTIGRAAVQKLVKLPDGSGLWLSTVRYLTPSGAPLHEKGVEPTIAVDEPEIDFGQPAPAGDAILDKALEHAGVRKAA
jgi:carboxyl-terminal processing protease